MRTATDKGKSQAERKTRQTTTTTTEGTKREGKETAQAVPRFVVLSTKL